MYNNAKIKHIYTLSDPLTGQVRYVGASVNPKQRYNRHVAYSNATNIEKRNWVAGLRGRGLMPKMELLDMGSMDTEEYWIDQFFAWGVDLLNVRKSEAFMRISRKLKNRVITENHRMRLSESGKKYKYLTSVNGKNQEFGSLLEVVKETGISMTHASRISKNGAKTETGISIKRVSK